jgi:predicted outer membrane repeat protein
MTRHRSWWTALSLLVAAAGAPAAEAVTVPGDFPTIQAAINAVVGGALPDGTVIDLQPGAVYVERISVVNTPRSLTVRSLGAAATLTANGTGTVISAIGATGTVRFENLVVTGGVGVPGSGGGLTATDSSPTFASVTFQNNTAVSGGGALLARSNALFSDCKFLNNSAQQFGGGLVVTQGSRPTFIGTTISGNVSGTAFAFGSGGGIASADASPTLIASVVSGNTGTFSGGGIMHITGFSAGGPPRVLRLEDSEVSGNTARRFDNGQNPAEGGGIHIEDNVVTQLVRSKVRNNTANSGGGLNAFRGRYEIDSSIIEGNQALDPLNVTGFGGGIAAQSNFGTPQAATVILRDSVVRDNTSHFGGGIFAAGDNACGGCDDFTAPKVTLTVENSLVSGNSATQRTGGIFVTRGNVTITGSHVLSNQTVTGPNAWGGGLFLVSGTTANVSSTTIAGNAAGVFGGGVFVDINATVTISNSNIYANSAATGGGIFVNNAGTTTGTVQNSQIADNVGFQIAEQACPFPGTPTILKYLNNRITNQGGLQLYNQCNGGAVNDINAFNAKPGNGGNTTQAPNFATFMATPDVTPSVLSWSVARAAPIAIAPAPGAVTAPTGTTDVSSAAAYTLMPSPGPNLVATVAIPPEPSITPFDRDGRADTALYRAATGQWLVTRSAGLKSTITWGDPALGDIPISGDFDADGQGDIAVYRGSTGQWFVLLSGGGVVILTWGDPAQQDVPVAADFDGDGRADITVYRGLTGQWFVLLSGGGAIIVTWGDPAQQDVPAPADFDGDGRADITVYRGSNGQWFVLLSGGGVIILTLGDPVQQDLPVPGKYDTDNRADPAIYRRTTGQWFVLNSGGGMTALTWGDPAQQDVPVPADYNGDGRTDIAVYRPTDGNWFALFLTAPPSAKIVNTGVPLAGDKAVPLKR